MAEMRQSFFAECEELLEAFQDGLAGLEEAPGDPDLIAMIFRAAHSIKGGAAAFQMDDLVAFAHQVEAALDRMRAGEVPIGAEVLKALALAADTLADLVAATRDETPVEIAKIATAVTALDRLFDGAQPMPAAECDETGRYNILFAPERELFSSGNEPLFLFRALSDVAEIETECDISRLPSLADLDPGICGLSWTIRLRTDADKQDLLDVFDYVDGLCTLELTSTGPRPGGAADLTLRSGEDRNTPQTGPVSTQRPTVRVDLDRVERLVNLIGELVINQSMLSQSVAALDMPANSPVHQGLEEFLQLTRDIQDGAMMIRAQPVKPLFQRMARAAREASALTGKEVQLVTSGGATEIDKTAIERLVDPLTHMVRNAVDHGIESAEGRIAAGKPPAGTLRLAASHRAGRVLIELSDDGAGLDRQAIMQTAAQAGIIAPGQALSDDETWALLFEPGFSTAKKPSSLSGRGVGMDVVKTSVQALGGRIGITSAEGRGTTFTISLPLTLAVLDGLLIVVAGQTLVLPLSSVQETLSLDAERIRGLGRDDRFVETRGQLLPLLDLGEVLGYRARLADLADCSALLIASDDGILAALLIDDIVDQRQVVIKALQKNLGQPAGIPAATILGDGQVALILDPIELIGSAGDAAPCPPFLKAG